jgi:two-component system cell cycle response regulator DivK
MDELPVCVLVVEDDVESSRLMCEVFALRGFHAHHAGTGASAIKLAQEHAPSLILMDIQLPDMDGTVVLSTLRETPVTAGIPVVAVTAFAMNGDRERFLAGGFDGYLSKPINVSTLVDEMAPLMQVRRD